MSSQMEETHRAKFGEECRAFMPSPDKPPPKHLHMSTIPEALQTLHFGDYCGGLITQV